MALKGPLSPSPPPQQSFPAQKNCWGCVLQVLRARGASQGHSYYFSANQLIKQQSAHLGFGKYRNSINHSLDPQGTPGQQGIECGAWHMRTVEIALHLE